MIKFSIGDQSVEPRDLENALMSAVLDNMQAQLTEKVGSIRDPDTGEFPTVIVRGDNLENFSVHVEGSPELVGLVKKRLGVEEQESSNDAATSQPPRVFMSYTSDDRNLAKRIAEAFKAKDVDVWWDEWCIYPGDSLRQKIDEGIECCTHFVVLLTPQSIKKPWVNQEMDAGLVSKLNDQCKFIPIRSCLSASDLPPLLSGMYSPEITEGKDIEQLINDICGVSRKPPHGVPPAAIEISTQAQTGYSAAASTVASWFVKRSQHALLFDPQILLHDLSKEIDLSVEDTTDALYELSNFVKISHDYVLVKGTLFAEFDRFWKPWNPYEDALRLAADIVNDPDFPASCKQIATRYEWEPRRLNPTIHYLLERHLIVDYKTLGRSPWAIVRIVSNEHTRRFVKSRM